MRRLVAVLLMLPLAGCGLFASKATREMRKSPDYHAGYEDGCSSAYGPDANRRNGADQVKDDQMFDTNKAYRIGWNSGFTACRTYTPQNVPLPSAGPIPDQNPGNGGIP